MSDRHIFLRSPNRVADDIPDLDASSICLEKFKLYETLARFYIIGRDKRKEHWRVLKIDRSEPSELILNEDPTIYTQQGIKHLLQQLSEGNKNSGGLRLVTKAYGIVGFAKFLGPYYMILVIKRRQVGTICGHAVYAVQETQLITIPHSSVQNEKATSKVELRYKKLLCGMDLIHDFFFSYTYRIMQSLQKNVEEKEGEGFLNYESMFVWNAFLTRGIRKTLGNSLWTVALVHGFFRQTKISLLGRVLVITLIARRSRHFAGTRYLKRGVNDKGRVANDVETEQIVIDEEGFPSQMASVVQCRGSIPLFWSQESKFSPKPKIILHHYDPMYTATKLHFDNLKDRYGSPIIILNLIKAVEKSPREKILHREFTAAVQYLNQNLSEEEQLKFIHWDFHRFAKSKSSHTSEKVLSILRSLANECLDFTGFYYSGKIAIPSKKKGPVKHAPSNSDNINFITSPSREFLVTSPARELSSISKEKNKEIQSETEKNVPFAFPESSLCRIASREKEKSEAWKEREKKQFSPTSTHPDQEMEKEAKFQYGVLRTNCIDCLDRTNVAQYAFGLEVLGRQLHVMSITADPNLDSDCSVSVTLKELYIAMGDSLSNQYGGSAAHNTVLLNDQGNWKATSQSREIIRSIRRYYSNAYTDSEKQDAMNLFLGRFIPQEGKPALWELDSDYYLHISGLDSPVESPKLKKKSVFSRPCAPHEGSPNHYPSGLSFPPSPLLPIPTSYVDGVPSKIKLTSLEKLTRETCGSLKSVRLRKDSDISMLPPNLPTSPHVLSSPSHQSAGLKNTNESSTDLGKNDIIELQRTPNWLFGQRKSDKSPRSHSPTYLTHPPPLPPELSLNDNLNSDENSNQSFYDHLFQPPLFTFPSPPTSNLLDYPSRSHFDHSSFFNYNDKLNELKNDEKDNYASYTDFSSIYFDDYESYKNEYKNYHTYYYDYNHFYKNNLNDETYQFFEKYCNGSLVDKIDVQMDHSSDFGLMVIESLGKPHEDELAQFLANWHYCT